MSRFSPTHACFRLSLLAAACCAMGWGAAPALAQQGQAARGSGFVPTLTVSESYLRGNGVISGVNGGEFVTRISPGLGWSSRSGRVRGSVNYALDASFYSKRADSSLIDNRLAGSVLAELVENFAFVDVQANIGQAAVSATGQQFAFDSFNGNENRTEVVSLQVSPYIVGRLGGFAEYQLRLGASMTDARDFDSADSNTRSAVLSLTSARGGGPLGWGLTAQHQDLSFRDGRDTQTSRVNARLIWQPDVDLQFFVSGGQETTNVGNIIRRTYDNYGAGGTWTPSPRTRVAVEGERRYFGNSYSAVLEHRTPRTVWRYVDSRGATEGGDPNAFNQPITLFDLFFEQFTSSFPDPIQRELAVRDFLRLIGRDPNELLNIGALVDVVSVQRRQELSAAWNGLRTAVSLQFFATRLRALETTSGTLNDPTTTGLSSSERGLTASVSYRLTPQSSVTASVTHQTSPGAGEQSRNRLSALSLGWRSQLSRTMNLDLSTRHSDFSSDTIPYRETAVSASINFRF